MPTKHRVRLDAQTRSRLARLVSTGTAHARTIQHARILLLTDEGSDGDAWSDTKTATALHAGERVVARVRRLYCDEGLDAALRVIKERAGRPPKIDGYAEAKLATLACSEAPQRHARWSVRLLTDRFAALGIEEGWHSKKPSQTVARQKLGDPAQAFGRVRGGDGARSRTLPSAVRREAASRLPR